MCPPLQPSSSSIRPPSIPFSSCTLFSSSPRRRPSRTPFRPHSRFFVPSAACLGIPITQRDWLSAAPVARCASPCIPRFLHCTASGTSRSSKPCHSGCCESRRAAEIAGEKAEKSEAQKESAENGSRQQRIIRNQENGRPHSRLRTATGNPTFIHSRCPRPPRSRSRCSPWITFIAALRSPLETHRPAEERLDARCSPSAPAASAAAVRR